MADIDMTTLFIRHLPRELSSDEKEDLLTHFGATSVRLMSQNGRMKHTAFATFPDSVSAKDAVTRLHQLEIIGCRLSAEFAQKSQASSFPKSSDNSGPNVESKSTDSTNSSASADSKKPVSFQESSRLKQILREKDNIYTKLGIDYPRNPSLLYAYPSPTVAILTNIMHALAAHPKLYIQVLHLMNKLNIPAPFGPITIAPPVPPGESSPFPPITEVEMEVESSEESELESDEEDPVRRDKKEADSRRGVSKRPRKNKHVKQPKKAKLLIQPPLPALPRLPDAPVVMTCDVFEQPTEQLALKRIELKLPGSVTDLAIDVPGEQDIAVHEGTITPPIEPSQADSEESQTTGFGKIEPIKPLPPEPEEANNELIYDKSQFLTANKLRAGQISKREWNKISVFKNYKSGDPTCRLYVKNVAKHITEQDLVNIFGGYAELETEQGQNAFDVRLMKEGRMKGQAFVSFVSEECASHALKDTNGYLLNDKPIVVQFARSTKAK